MSSDQQDKPHKNVLVQRISLEVPGQYLGLVTLNRPQEMNALDWATIKDLRSVLEGLSADNNVRVIAITGAGKAFSAGGDLKAYLTLERDAEGFRGFLNDFRATCRFMETLGRPVIALVNGYCVAGGLELLLACDFAYAARSAKIGDGHVNFGQIGGAGSNIRLPRWILPQRAREILFTGRLLTADEAMEWGLVNRVVADEKLLEAGVEFANLVAAKSPLGESIIKEICNLGLEMPLEDALQLEIDKVVHYALRSYDCREGLIAFFEKRRPRYEGR